MSTSDQGDPATGAAARLATPRAFVRQVSGGFAAQASAAAMGAVTSVVAVRLLGAAAFGRVAVALAIVSIAVILATGHLVAGVTYHMARLPAAEVMGTAAALAAFGAAAIASIVFVLERAGALALGASTAPTMALCVLLSVDLILASALRAQGRVALASVIDAGESMVVLAGVLLLRRSLTPQLVLMIYVVASASSVVVTGLVAAHESRVRTMAIDRKLAWRLARFGLPLWGAIVAQYAIYRVDIVLLQAIEGSRSAGVYAAATKLAETLLLLPIVVGNAVSARSASLQPEELARSTPRIYRATLVILLAAAAALAALAPIATRLLFGAEFAGAGDLLRLLLPGVAFIGAAAVLFEDLVQHGGRRSLLLASVTGLAVAGFGWAVLIPQHGAAGAALGSVAAYAAIGAAAVLAYGRSRSLPVTRIVFGVERR